MENRTLVAIPLKMGLLLVPLGCGSPTGPVLLPSESCSGQPDNAIVTFEDAGLQEATSLAVERTRPPLGFLGTRDRLDLTCGRISGLTSLAWFQPPRIESLVGIQNLTSLTELNLITNLITDISLLSGLTSLQLLELGGNSISDISPLNGLTSLQRLHLNFNLITDISALSGLTGLKNLVLDGNPGISNIQPLLDNTGLGAGDIVELTGTSVSCTDVAALQAKGVAVVSDCP